MIRQDDLLKTPVETVVKRIATLEEESGGVLKVASISEASGKVNPAGADKQVSEIEEMVNKTVELKLEEFRSSQGPLSAAVRREEDRRAGKDLVQSQRMFAELAMVVATGLAVVRL